MTRSADDALVAWSRRHGGYDIGRSRVIRGWLRFVWALSAPLARVPADVVSAAGVLCAAAAVVAPAGAGAGLVVATGVLDGVDGAVAHRRGACSVGGATSARGALGGTTADRVSDALLLSAL